MSTFDDRQFEQPGPFSEVNPVIQAWVRQILSPTFVRMLEVVADGQIEIRLFANRGKVRKEPVIILNAGPSENVPTDEI